MPAEAAGRKTRGDRGPGRLLGEAGDDGEGDAEEKKGVKIASGKLILALELLYFGK